MQKLVKKAWVLPSDLWLWKHSLSFLTGLRCFHTVPWWCRVFSPKLGLCWIFTYLVCKCILQRQIWSRIGCKNVCCCIFSHDEQFSTSKGHESICRRQRSGMLVFSEQGWRRPMPVLVLTNCCQILRFSLADTYCVPFFATEYGGFTAAQRSPRMVGQG